MYNRFRASGTKQRFSPNYLCKCVVLLIICFGAIVVIFRWTSQKYTHDLTYLKRSRDLRDYVNEIENILIEPEVFDGSPVPLVALVPSAPNHVAERDAIRSTWGTAQPTYFFLGLSGQMNHVKQMEEVLVESQTHDDIILSGFIDHYDNLTLKVCGMMRWAMDRWPHAKFVAKVDDDVLLNPWMIKRSLDSHTNSSFIGKKYVGHRPIRNEHDKWYLPTWLYRDELFPEYLGGPCYIIRGDLVSQIYSQALKTPLINLEDIFYTYLVAKRSLKFSLTHEPKFQTDWLRNSDPCSYWSWASIHDTSPKDMLYIWPKLQEISKLNDICSIG